MCMYVHNWRFGSHYGIFRRVQSKMNVQLGSLTRHQGSAPQFSLMSSLFEAANASMSVMGA